MLVDTATEDDTVQNMTGICYPRPIVVGLDGLDLSMARTHVILPDELLEEIDNLVGKRKRSQFLAEAAENELKRLRRIKLAEQVAGSLRDVDIPGWETEESTLEWIRKMRESSNPWNDTADEDSQ